MPTFEQEERDRRLGLKLVQKARKQQYSHALSSHLEAMRQLRHLRRREDNSADGQLQTNLADAGSGGKAGH